MHCQIFSAIFQRETTFPRKKMALKMGFSHKGKNLLLGEQCLFLNPVALRKAKIACNFGLS